jgi:hypothetical protein
MADDFIQSRRRIKLVLDRTSKTIESPEAIEFFRVA